MSIAPTYAHEIMDIILGFVQSAVGGLNPNAVSIGNIPPIIIPPMDNTFVDFSFVRNLLTEVEATRPTLPDFISIDQSVADPVNLETLPAAANVEIPDFTDTMVPVSIPAAPVLTQDAPPTLPVVEAVATPTRPTYTLPDVPVLNDVQLPSPIPLDLPAFAEVLADDGLLAPTNIYQFNEAGYSSEIQDAVVAALMGELSNGVFGLFPRDETDLFNRERDREIVALRSGIENIRRQANALGLPIPQGAIMNQLQKARQDYLNKVSSVNRDISTKRADLYFQGKQFTYEKLLQLEQMKQTLYHSMMERALNAMKIEAQVAIDIFNAEIARYNLKVERYKAQAQVYRTRIDAELAKTEIYKAQVQAAQVGTEINRSLVALYSERLNGIRTLIETYKTDAEVANILASIERLKIEQYKTEVDAFVSLVQAKKLQLDAYEAQLRGEQTKVEVYKTQAQAYSAVVEGKKTAIDADRVRLQRFIETNKSLIDLYNLRVTEKASLRDAQKAELTGQIETYKAETQGYAAEVGALSEAYKVGVAATEASYKTQLNILLQNVEIAKLEAERVLTIAKLNVESSKAMADVQKALVAAALSAMNINASLADHYTATDSASISSSIDTKYIHEEIING